MDKQPIISDMIRNIEKIIVGKRSVIEKAIITLLAGGHLLLEDVPGVGKTTLANGIAKTINCGFTRIQFTPDTLPSDITGLSVYNMQTGKFEFVKGAIMNQIILADEINRTSPKTQASLLEAMQEGQVSVEGTTYELPKPFMVIATQNPIDYVGTYNLPEASLDRFLMKLSMGYPSVSDEIHMIESFLQEKKSSNLEPVVEESTILKMQKDMAQIDVHQDLLCYIVEITDATRNNSNITLGASPRATLALTRAAQANAYIKGRDYVIPDDIKDMVISVIAHRLIMSPEARLNKQTAHSVVQSIIEKIKIPIL